MRTLLGLMLFVLGAVTAHPVLAASENAKRDANRVPVSMGVTGDAARERRMFRMDPNTGQLLVSFSQTHTGAKPEVYIVGIPFSVTVHGDIMALLSIPFSQTIHGDVNATVVAVAFSQTVHGNVVVTALPAITGAVDATLVHVPFSQTMHGSVVVTTLPAITGTIDATIVHVPFSQTVHGRVIVTSLPAITGAVDSTVVHVPFSQTVHGKVVVTSLPAITGAVDATVVHVAFSQTVHGSVIVTSMPAITGAVDSTIVHIPWSVTVHGKVTVSGAVDASVVDVPFSQTVHGKVEVTSLPAITGAVDATVVDVPFSQTMHGAVTARVESRYEVLGDVGVVAFPPGSRTNSALYSDRLDTGANWTGYKLFSLTVDAEKGPTGSPTAEQLVDNTENDSHGIYTAGGYIDVTPGESLTVSIDAKTSGRDWLQINLYDTLGESDAGQWFNITEGFKGNTVAINTTSIYVESSRIFLANNGHYRCVVTFHVEDTYTDVGNENIYFAMGLKANNDAFQTGWYATYVGDESSGVYLTNAQVEYNQHSVGPRIRTLGSAVTSGSPFLGTVGVEPGTTVIQASQVALNLGPQPTTLGKKQDTPQSVDAWGLGMMVVRRDIATGPSANNDWMAAIADEKGRLWTHLGAIDWSVSMHGAAQGQLAGAGLVTWTFTTDGAGRIVAPVVPTGMRVTASQYEVPVNNAGPVNLFPNNLPGATHVEIQNWGTGAIYLGDSNVSAAAPFGTNGIRVAANGGGQMFDAVSDNWTIYAIGTKAAVEDVRVMRW